MTFDSTVHLSDMVVVGGGIIAFLKVYLADRDVKRQMAGVLDNHEKRIVVVEDRTENHHTWLIRNRMDELPPLGRRSYDRGQDQT